MSPGMATTKLMEYQTVPLCWKTSASTYIKIIGGFHSSTRMSINSAKTGTLRLGANTSELKLTSMVLWIS